MTIAMKNAGDGSNEQETTAPSVNQNANQNNTGDVNTADSQMASEVEDENLVDPVTGEPYFPVNELIRLEEMISRTRWVVPVLPKCELEILLDASILLCKKGLDTRSDACQRFFQEGLTKSFTKVLTDEAVSSWKYDIHRCILQNCYKLVELCVTKLSQDWFPLLDLLAMVLNPHCKFHSFNLTRPSESIPPNVPVNEDEVFSKPLDVRAPRGWLVDLINRFGKLNGFQILLERFQSGQNLTLPVMYALMRPFGLCAEMLTVSTIVKYFLPIIEVIPAFLDNLTDEELKKEAKNEGKNDVISAVVKFLKNLAARVPNQEEMLQNLEMFRLKMILRLLQISSFNGKMNALNEINKVIASVSTYPQRAGQSIVGGANEAEEEWLTAERMAGWLKEHKVLQIVLSDSLHQPQYVEKLEKILRFVIKEKALTLDDLDRIWASQVGKHEAIVKNVHDLLAKLAWDFSPEQLDHLFECFQASWTTAGKKQREKLLELIRRLAEDDKDGVMAHKVLTLFWNLAHSPDVPNEIMDQAMNAHVKILDYSCSQDRDAQKTHWLDRCVEEIRQNQWVLQALKQIRDICLLYSETPANFNHAAPHAARAPNVLYRQEVVNRLQQQHALVILITDNLCGYMDRIRALVKDNAANYDPQTFMPDDRYSHVMQVQERLNFLRFLLKDGQLWLCAPQARQIWNCLVENAIFVADREACFKWFSKLMGEEPDLDPEVNKEFFENQILRLDPALMTESGMKCFDRFFNAVNAKEGRMVARRKINDVDLIGLDYLWRVILSGTDSVADKAILLLKETYTGLGPRLINSQVEIHEDLISSCIDRLRASHDTLRACLYQKQQQQNEAVEKDFLNRTRQETARMCRVLKLLQDYVTDYDCDFQMREERTLLPLGRAFRGKNFMLIIRFPNQGRQPEDLELWTHSNETLATVRRHILNRIKSGNVASASANLQQQQQGLKLDLFLNNELIETTEDFRLVSELHLRDRTLLTAKLSQSNAAAPGSPDSSSDSSTGGSPQHTTNSYQGLTQYSTAAAAENTLPGILMSRDRRVIPFLCQIADLGCLLKHAQLRDSARNLLRLLPADPQAVDRLFGACRVSRDQQNDVSTSDIPGSLSVLLESIFFGPSASTVLYHLEVAFSLFMPANFPMAEKALEFQYSFIQSGGIPLILNMLRNNSFITSADVQTKRSAFLGVLRLAKVVLTVLSYLCWRDSPEGSANPQQIPLPLSDYFVRAVANQLVPHLQVDSASLCSVKPELSDVHAVIRLAWASSNNQYKLLNCPWEEMGQYPLPQQQQQQQQQQDNEYSEDMQLCKEALEVLTVANFICPHITEQLAEDKTFFRFVLEVVLLCPSKLVRSMAAEQLLQMTTIFPQRQLLQSFITALLSVLHTTAKEFASSSHEYFQLLCRLLNYATSSGIAVPQAEEFLQNEIQWLKKAKDNFVATGSTQAEDELLEGHLSLIREFVSHLGPNKKFEVGTDESKGVLLIRELLEDFLYPASRVMLHYNKTGEMLSVPSDPISASSVSANSALDLLVALSTGCVENMRLLVAMLTDMFFTDEYNEPLTEWEYLPPVGPRPGGSFVGLKNAGATCYMNSVLQQLFMIERLRRGVLSADGAAQDPDEDFSGEDKLENDTDTSEEQQLQQKSREESARDYNVNILKQLQAIFGHLAYSKLQYYVPRGLWRHFKLQGEPVNLREQQDAVEFYMSLTDSVDEALKALNCEQIMGRTLVGVFSDQKICKGCPHRYCKEQPFNVISVDIRNHSNLHDSLEQYVKGELLEGGDAYHCEKCNKKVNTVKRLCVKKLPPILAIQLKRFEYDYERLCPIKFNDYFEFPRVLDMEPYTVWGLAKAEGQVIDYDIDGGEITGGDVCTRYHLTGVVVHSGQASGGHYYSYILQRSPSGEGAKWYKFDDGDVTECKMDDDEEMKNQCFGGEYMGEVFDHVVKRMSYRRQKRWWNAYILFYTREDVDLCSRMSDLSLSDEKLPTPIERSVRKQNNKFQHTFNIFSPEFFQFVRKLVGCNSPIISGEKLGDKPGSQAEELALLSVQIGTRFLFNACLHTKKTLRGAANDWYEVLVPALRFSRKARTWLAQKILFAHPQRFSEYLLQCPSAEVRSAFAKILVSLAHFSLGDGSFSPEPNSHSSPTDWSLADHIFHAVLGLLNKEVADYGRHLSQYFNLFLMYASLGAAEKAHLLRLNVPATFMTVALDEGPGPPIKYQYAELGKLYQVVCLLIRCCDVSSKMSSSVAGSSPLVNSLGETPIMPLQPQVAEILYGKNTFVKKLLEDAGASEETARLLRFCCWENDHFSSTVLSDLLWQIAFAYTYELRPHLDLLLAVLTLEDSWQKHRIMAALRGIPDDRDGLFDIIQRSKSHYHKRGYQCIKFLVALFSQCPAAYQVLLTNGELKRKWAAAVDWLHEELDRRPYAAGNNQYGYNNWSPPAQSNETSNGYFLERSNSARLTLEKAIGLCPEEEQEGEEPPIGDGEEQQTLPPLEEYQQQQVKRPPTISARANQQQQLRGSVPANPALSIPRPTNTQLLSPVHVHQSANRQQQNQQNKNTPADGTIGKATTPPGS